MINATIVAQTLGEGGGCLAAKASDYWGDMVKEVGGLDGAEDSARAARKEGLMHGVRSW